MLRFLIGTTAFKTDVNEDIFTGFIMYLSCMGEHCVRGTLLNHLWYYNPSISVHFSWIILSAKLKRLLKDNPLRNLNFPLLNVILVGNG